MFRNLFRVHRFSCNMEFSTVNLKRQYTYDDTIRVLNSLISNAHVIKSSSNTNTDFHLQHIPITKMYCERVNVELSDIDKLNIIHVAGTKGKGSTCTYIEAILRHHGYKTGLFTSPHLKEVRERIQVNGSPLPINDFNDYFWTVYEKLNSSKTHPHEMPFYFQFLTILAFDVFVKEKVDFVILETGIGGRFDSTNIISHPVVACITALGYDHMEILGSTISEIAWNKAGIIKPKSIVFTCDNQPKDGLQVIEDEVKINDGKLYLIPTTEERKIDISGKEIGIHRDNVLLASAICRKLLRKDFDFDTIESGDRNHVYKVPSDVVSCSEYESIIYSTPNFGRYQKMTKGKVEYFIDGAHTVESIKTTVEWFKEIAENKSYEQRYLLFMVTGCRCVEKLLVPLTVLDFNGILLSPLVPFRQNQPPDFATDSDIVEREKCKLAEIAATWTRINLLNSKNKQSTVEYFQCLADVKQRMDDSGKATQVLVVGSLHLVGCMLAALS